MGIDLGQYYLMLHSHGSSQGILALRDWNIEGSGSCCRFADEELPALRTRHIL